MGTGRRSLLGAVIAFATLLGLGGLAYRNAAELIGTQAWIAHTHEVLDTLDATVSLMKDAEIAVRGYLVTGADDLARAGKTKEAISQWQHSVKEFQSAARTDADPEGLAKVNRKLDAARVRLAKESGKQ